jgi:type I restriction-modification system DNA methylase subunit
MRRAVADLIEARLIPDLRKAIEFIDAFKLQYPSTEEVGYNWHEDDYLEFHGVQQTHRFDQHYINLLDDLNEYSYALRAETEILGAHADRSGLDRSKVSFLKNNDESKSAKEAFVQETSSLLLSRMLMIRFSEDHRLLKRYISNGGLRAFSNFATHFNKNYQSLVRAAYDNARSVYRYLFDKKPLDWIIDSDDGNLSAALLHAMWIMARWDFATVRGDILSGVYDRYLDPTQRKRLGEIYTRPELARYMLEACAWDGSQKILDPAVGSGTFLVEAFDMTRRRAEGAGAGFDMQDALELLPKLNGLDINEFSAALAKIQLLWHVISCVRPGQESLIRDSIRQLHIEGGRSSLDTWGLPMAVGQNGMLMMEERAQRRGRRVHERKFEVISTASENYGIVIGNPPFIRIHRITMSEEEKTEYSEVIGQQTDLSALFVYRTLKWWLQEGGRMALFLPLALTEAAYAEKLRNLILQYKIIEIVDLELLGNIAFHGANIVTVILIVEKSPAFETDNVKITSVGPECIDTEAGTINMSLARSEMLLRRDISLTSYLPQVSETTDEEGDEEEAGSGNSLLTKIKPADVQLLSRLARLPRLASLIEVGYFRREGRTTFKACSVPEEDSHLWERRLIRGRGLEIGGRAPQDSGGKPILKGGDTYPDAVEGDPMGHWNGLPASVSTVRFYSWLPCFAPERAFVSREISLAPTVAPHPRDTFLQNTVYIVQLAEYFPLNVYVLSRIPQWFMVKTARASSIQKLYAHWFPRNLLRLPVPGDMNPEIISGIKDIGERLFARDREIAQGIDVLNAFLDLDSDRAVPLRRRLDLFSTGQIVLPGQTDFPLPTVAESWVDATAVENEESIVFAIPQREGLFEHLHAPTESGNPCRIVVRDEKLRKWFLFLLQRHLAEKQLPTMSWIRSQPVPNNIGEALEVLGRIQSGAPRRELDEALNDLDTVVATACGLSEDDLRYIVDEMNSDPFLMRMQPAWRHSTSRRRGYVEYGQGRNY